METIWISGLAVAAYLVAAVMLARGVARDEPRNAAPLALATIAVLLHAGFHWIAFHRAGGADVHFLAALSLVGLGMAALSLAMAWLKPVAAVGVVAFPIAAAMLSLDAMLGSPSLTLAAQGWQIRLHVVLALLAFAALAIAALVAVMLAIQEHALRTRRLGGLHSVLPPLTLIEAMLFQLIGAGFVLLSLTLLTGALFVEDLFGQHLVHKTVLSFAAWLVFGALLFGRWRYGWRGRRAVRLTLIGMVVLLLAFFGSKFVLEIVLKRVV